MILGDPTDGAVVIAWLASPCYPNPFIMVVGDAESSVTTIYPDVIIDVLALAS